MAFPPDIVMVFVTSECEMSLPLRNTMQCTLFTFCPSAIALVPISGRLRLTVTGISVWIESELLVQAAAKTARTAAVANLKNDFIILYLFGFLHPPGRSGPGG